MYKINNLFLVSLILSILSFSGSPKVYAQEDDMGSLLNSAGSNAGGDLGQMLQSGDLGKMGLEGLKTNDGGGLSSGLGELGKLGGLGGNLAKQLGGSGSSASSGSGQGNSFFNSGGSFNSQSSFNSQGSFNGKGTFGSSGSGSFSNAGAGGSSSSSPDISQMMSGQGMDNLMQQMPENLQKMKDSNQMIQDLLKEP